MRKGLINIGGRVVGHIIQGCVGVRQKSFIMTVVLGDLGNVFAIMRDNEKKSV